MLDPWQWQRLSDQPADFFFVVNSLRLGWWDYRQDGKDERKKLLLKFKKLEFINNVFNFIKQGGVFITEQHFNSSSLFETAPLIPHFDPITAKRPSGWGWGYSVERTGVYIKSDDAMASDLGGIDLNPAQMSMQIKKEGGDFKFDFNGKEIDAAQVTGATFTIRQMVPVTNLPLVLGLSADPA